jgi:hypothetical protein
MGSRHERLLWAAHKIAHLTGTTEGRAYQMLLIALIEAERRNSMTAHESDVISEGANIGLFTEAYGLGFECLNVIA